MTILLSLNAVAILVAGVLIASALSSDNSVPAIVAERSDEVSGEAEDIGLNESASVYVEGQTVQTEKPRVVNIQPVAPNSVTEAGETTDGRGQATGGSVPTGELWNETEMTLYRSADRDICIDKSLPGYNNMYWQTSNKAVIAGLYNSARVVLGYTNNKCRTPKIVGAGTTVITAGTKDGSRRDKITVNVVDVPIGAWKMEVLNLVNQERSRSGLGALAWGANTAGAAEVRVQELLSNYSHTRPDGTEWKTALSIPAGNYAGENVAAGPSVPSPATVVAAWMASESHRANILSANYRYMSVGVYFEPSNGNMYWAQIFSSF